MICGNPSCFLRARYREGWPRILTSSVPFCPLSAVVSSCRKSLALAFCSVLHANCRKWPSLLFSSLCLWSSVSSTVAFSREHHPSLWQHRGRRLAVELERGFRVALSFLSRWP